MPTLKYYRRIFSAYLFKRRESNLSFWFTPLSVNALEQDDLASVDRYPQNFECKTRYRGVTDEDGVIRLNYFGTLGCQYNPNAIAQLALGHYDLYRSTDSELHKRLFLKNAAWFLKHGKNDADETTLWTYDFPWECRGGILQKGWRSALAQGQALSVLIRAHKITGDDRYAEAAKMGYNPFRYSYREHSQGVLSHDNGYLWLEEIIIDPPNHILNGFVWALWGVYEYGKYFADSHANGLFAACVHTLKENLWRYDLGYWTSYDLVSRDGGQPVMPASNYYHRLHVTQLEGLYNITGLDVFLEYQRRWQGYLHSPYCRNRALLKKILFKMRYF